MHHHRSTLVTALTAVLAALPAAQAGLYTKTSPVLQVDSRSYDRLIAKSNQTSIVEFYAPWCGHCQNLKPAYEKAAKNLDGLAKVAAIDCDDDANKQFCGSMGVQGFPTLKIVRPSKKPGSRPVVEDYQGPRTANSIVETVASKINNHVTRLTDKELDAFLAGDKPKAILFTEKGTTSALLRSIAIDFLDVLSVGQIRNKEKAAVEKFGIKSFPTLVLLHGKGQDPIQGELKKKDLVESEEADSEPIIYNGELNKKDMVKFLSQAGHPNPDPAPVDAKRGKEGKGDKKKKKSTQAADEKVSDKKVMAEPEESPESSTATTTTTTESAARTPDIIPIATITAKDMLVEKCLQPSSHTCVLAFVPSEASEQGDKVVASLSQLNTKYIHGRRHLFPFFSVPSDVEGTSALRDSLKLNSDVDLIILNARRLWWRHYEGDFGVDSVEDWIDAIRMGEGKKNDLPKDVVMEQDKVETTSEESAKEATKATDATDTADATEATNATEATEATDAEPKVETETPEPKEKIMHEEL